MTSDHLNHFEWIAVDRMRRGAVSVQVMVLIDANEREGLEMLAVVQTSYEARHDGLPTDTGFKRADEFEEKVVPILEESGALFVGRIKSEGLSSVYFYGPPKAFPSEITTSKKSLFSKKTEIHKVESRPDPLWTFYEEELKPMPVEYEIARSRPLHKALAKHGDRHSEPRPVDFKFLFPTTEGRVEFPSEMAERQIFLNEEGTWENFDGEGWPYWCSLVFATAIDPPTIGQICAEFRAVARSNNGEFDGWACPVAN
jgi:hypothetical protein